MTFQAVSFVNDLDYGAEDVRHLSYLASMGQTGTATADSLRVTATATPSTSVIVNAGVATIRGTSLVSSYVVTNDQAVTLPVPANNGSGVLRRTVIYSVRDPQMAGMPQLSGPNDTAGDLQVVTSLPTDRPYIILADINFPANTGTVTNAMITDRRAMALTRSVTRSFIHYPSYTNPIGTTYEQIAGAAPTFYCPPGMTHANIIVVAEGVEQVKAGYVRMMCTPTLNGMRANLSQEVAVTRSGPIQRHSFTAMGAFKLPAGVAGTNVTIGLRGYVAAGQAGMLETDPESCMLFQVEFFESV